MPDPRAPSDNSSFVSKELRKIVSTTPCPTCGAKAGNPCFNLNFTARQQQGETPRRKIAVKGPDGKSLKDDEGRTVWRETNRKSYVRYTYTNYIHANRRRAHLGLQAKPQGALRIILAQRGNWDEFVAEKYRAVVKRWPCPSCGVPAGIPCVITPFNWEKISKFGEPAPAYHLTSRVHRRRYSQIITKVSPNGEE